MTSAVETLIRKVATPVILKVAKYNRDHMKAPNEPHGFLTGIHEPVTNERTVTDLRVTGNIPADLNGRYIRIGPNPITPPNPGSYHWFTGDGMVHGVSLKDGKALWYRNRWIRSTAVSAALGEAPAPGPRHGPSDTVNTNVLGHAGQIWALVEAGGYPVRIDDELNTIAHDPFGGSLKGSFTAHPHLDPETGEMHAICYEGTDQNTIRHVVVDAAGKVRREEPIAVQHGPSIHDCAITKSYVIIMDMPLNFSMKSLLAGHAFPYSWNTSHTPRIGLLPRDGTNADVIWCAIEPCFVFHPCNAFENADGTVTMDVCAHNNMGAHSTQGPDSDTTPFERWHIDPVTKQVKRAVIDADPQEFPRPDERYTGKPYRYAYSVALPRDGAFQTADSKIYKHDLESGTRQTRDFGTGCVPGEFVFLPRNKDAAEGDGWLMGYVIDTNADTTDLVILNAQDFLGEPQAVVHIPHRIPAGFHGNWIAA